MTKLTAHHVTQSTTPFMPSGSTTSALVKSEKLNTTKHSTGNGLPSTHSSTASTSKPISLNRSNLTACSQCGRSALSLITK